MRQKCKIMASRITKTLVVIFLVVVGWFVWAIVDTYNAALFFVLLVIFGVIAAAVLIVWQVSKIVWRAIKTQQIQKWIRQQRIKQAQRRQAKAQRRQEHEQRRQEQEQIRQAQITQEQIKHEQIRLEQIRQEQIKQEQIRQEQITQEQIRQEGIRQGQIREEQIRQGQIREEQIREEQIRQEQIRQEQIREEQSEARKNRIIPPQVKQNVWQRDGGRCVECGSKEKLEYDHIIPVSKGGSNTERNVQLLCEHCNRTKHANIR
jgi:flagellar biosynthesis GTPase FlhF